jgi:hypothetical protein
VTIAKRPSEGGTAKVLDLIWVRREWKNFCRQDWTAGIKLIRFKKFHSAREPETAPQQREFLRNIKLEGVNQLTPLD